MKITKLRLKQIIKEEMTGLIEAEMYDRNLFGDEGQPNPFLPEAPSTRSQKHQRQRNFKRP